MFLLCLGSCAGVMELFRPQGYSASRGAKGEVQFEVGVRSTTWMPARLGRLAAWSGSQFPTSILQAYKSFFENRDGLFALN